MKSIPCPKCGTALHVEGLVPGSAVNCPACGNVTVAPRSSNRKVFLIIAAAVGVVLFCPCVGMIAAVTIPNFIKFQTRSKQGECKANLKAWYTAQQAYQQEKDTYSLAPSDLGFSIEKGNRYAYFSGPGPQMGFGVDTVRHPGTVITFAQLPGDVASQVGLSGECPACDITLACAGQIDKDATLDVWTISTTDRQAADGASIPKGTPFQHVDDTIN